MPYVRYRGAWSGSIGEQVAYEDPGAPCYEGRVKLQAEARLVVEDSSTDPTARAHAIERYVSDHPYPGLEHVGGVGFVEDKPVPPFCEEISVEAYRQLRSEIEKANAEYRARKADTLSKNNDPLRRASPEHERLGWRTRVWVTSYTELDHHVAYSLSEDSVAYLRVRRNDPSGSGCTAQLVDIYHQSNGDVQQALLEGIDWAEMLVDLLALTGYGAAQVEGVLGTTVPFCKIGEDFQLATFGAYIRNTAVPVSPSHLEAARPDKVGLVSLRLLRDGLSAPLPTAAFAAFWNALERLADEKARTENLRRMVTCEECGAERAAGPDTKQGFEAMYAEAGLSLSLFDRHRAKRGTIQHGAKVPSTRYLDEVFQDLSQVQTAAVVAVSKKVSVAPSTTTYLSTCWPVTVFSCHVEHDGKITAQIASMGVRAAANALPQRISGDADRTIEFGVSSPPKIDPLSLPPVQR